MECFWLLKMVMPYGKTIKTVATDWPVIGLFRRLEQYPELAGLNQRGYSYLIIKRAE